LVATLGYVTLDSTDNLLRLETAAGARRSHTLADGSRIDLNGATVLVLDRTRPRFAKVEKGEALFTVVHDPERPFGVEAGGTYIKDVGTVFNVAFSGGELEVAVAEGEVILNPNREAVNLSAGMVIRTEGARAVVSRTEVESIGGWRAGRLSYDAASFSKIAQDLSRNLGIPVKLDPQLAKRRFSGVIVLDPDRTLVLRRVAGLLEVDARRTGDGGWNLTVAGAS
jgi:transmembrane sensor